MCSLSEANSRAFARPLRLDGAVFGWGTGVKRVDQPSGDLRNVTHGVIKCGLIGMGRLCKAADLADELKRRRLNLRVGCRRLEIKKWSDVSTHTYNDGAPTAMSRAAVCTVGVDS